MDNIFQGSMPDVYYNASQFLFTLISLSKPDSSPSLTLPLHPYIENTQHTFKNLASAPF